MTFVPDYRLRALQLKRQSSAQTLLHINSLTLISQAHN